MGYVKTVIADPSGSNPAWMISMLGKIEGMSLAYTDDTNNWVFQYKTYDIFIRVYTGNGYNMCMYADKNANELISVIQIPATPVVPQTLKYVAIKNGICIIGLGRDLVQLCAWQEDGKVYYCCSSFSGNIYEVTTGKQIILPLVSIGNVIDPTNVSRAVMVPVVWNTSVESVPLYSKIAVFCLNDVYQALPPDSVVMLDGKPYFKMLGTDSKLALPIDTEVSA